MGVLRLTLSDVQSVEEFVGSRLLATEPDFSLNQAPEGDAQFDAGSPTKFVIESHGQLSR